MAIASPYQLLGTRGVIRAVWSFGFGSLLMSIKHGTLNSVSAGTARTRAPVIPSAACSMSGAAGDSGRSHASALFVVADPRSRTKSGEPDRSYNPTFRGAS